VNLRNFLPAAAFALAISFCAAITAQAEIINVTYSLTGSGSGDPLNPPLIGTATGSLLPLGSVTWSDMIFPDLAAGVGDGTFKMTFADGDTRFGIAHYVPDFSVFPIVPITQLLTVTGGTGAFLDYHGILTGLELSDQTNGTFHVLRRRNARHGSGTRLDCLVRDRAGELACIPKTVTPVPVG
jgi:hypothetical protein